MEIIAFIVIVLLFVYFNSRLRVVEEAIKNRTTIKTNEGQPVSSYAQNPSLAPKPIEHVETAEPYHATPFSASKPLDEEVGGQWLGKIGILAVFIGVAFFLKYAFDNNIIGVMGRIILGLIAGLFLIGLGKFLRRKYQLYSDILMGGGVGVLYLTIYAAFSFYSLITPATAFGLLIGVTALSVIISIMDSAVTLAVIGIAGGFLTPLLFSLNTPNTVSLFTYILIIDLGVFFVALRYKWKVLNYIAFGGTLVIFFNWYARFYDSSLLRVTFLFGTLYFLVFLFVTIMHNINRKERTDEGDLALITLNAVSYSGILYLLFNPAYHDRMGFIMLGLSLFYFLVSAVSFSRNPEDNYLNIYLTALSVLFLTLAIPIQFQGVWITVFWLVEAALLFITDYSVRGRNLYNYGSIIFFVGMVRFFIFDNRLSGTISDFVLFNNKRFFLLVLAVASAYVISYILHREKQLRSEDMFKSLLNLFLVVAQLLTIYAVSSEIYYLYDQKVNTVTVAAQSELKTETVNNGSLYSATYDLKIGQPVRSLKNERNTIVSILWALYAIILMAIGFAKKSRTIRIFGLSLFFVTAVKVFADVWSIGPIYRIVSSIAFGILALIGSFAYAKFKDRLKKIV